MSPIVTTATALLACFAAFGPASAAATTLAGGSSFTFEAPIASRGAVHTGVETDLFRFGRSPAGFQDNLLRITGDTFDAAADTPFRIATFDYRNGITYVGTNVDGLALRATLTFDGAAEPVDFTFDLDLDVTPNLTGDAVLDADTLTLRPARTSAAEIEFGGRMLTLHLVGFGHDGSSPISDVFTLPEDQQVSAGLYARFSEPIRDVASVPEPGSMAVVLAGGCLLLNRRPQARA